MRSIRNAFNVDETVVTALKNAELTGTTFAERLRSWAKQDGRNKKYIAEYLIPRVPRSIERAWPEFTTRQTGHLDLAAGDLAARARELAPWSVPWPLGNDLATLADDAQSRGIVDRILFRRDLINGTVAAFLGDAIGDTTVLDIGCNSGFFSMDMAERGAKHVDGVDLRPQNIAQAQFLAERYGVTDVDFAVGDAVEFSPDRQWDVVLNLGLLYHVTDPYGLLCRTYDLCREFAIVDTLTHREPVSAYLLRGELPVSVSTVGREPLEFLPTYRGAIETIAAAGFSEVVEIVGHAPLPHDLYERGARRCFLAIK